LGGRCGGARSTPIWWRSRRGPLLARARLRYEQHRFADAVDDLRAAHRQRSGPSGTSMFAQATLAEALHASGEVEPARPLAARAVADAERWGVAWLRGFALRVHGLIEGGRRGQQALERAAALLADSPARLEHARALVDLGAARRRANERAAARGPLAAGMELAFRCGAELLTRHAREELVACGARPRRLVRSGVDALTPSELRVARLAADGHTNREIAQALWVARTTVETHLSAIYRKLDVNDRALLPDLLAAKDQGAPDDARTGAERDAVLP
jgi:DNA-binding CsgD family transcriptional regulator